MASSSEEHVSETESEETEESEVVNCQMMNPRVNFLLKGGGADDDGIQIDMGFDEEFNGIYVHYAKRVGVKPYDLRFYNRNAYNSPDETTFEKDIHENDVVLAYYKDCKTIVSINPKGNHLAHKWRCFNIQNLMTRPTVHLYNVKKTTLMKNLAMNWAQRNGLSSSQVELHLDGRNVTGTDNLVDAQIYDGAVVYGVKKN